MTLCISVMLLVTSLYFWFIYLSPLSFFLFWLVWLKIYQFCWYFQDRPQRYLFNKAFFKELLLVSLIFSTFFFGLYSIYFCSDLWISFLISCWPILTLVLLFLLFLLFLCVKLGNLLDIVLVSQVRLVWV